MTPTAEQQMNMTIRLVLFIGLVTGFIMGLATAGGFAVFMWGQAVSGG